MIEYQKLTASRDERGHRWGVFGATLLGEGSHSQVFRLPSPSSEGLVVSVAQSVEGRNMQAWVKALQKLKSLRLPLVPPFELVHCGDLRALVTVYGDEDLRPVSEHWQPLQVTLTEMEQRLGQEGLQICDYWQLRQWRGTPFICDLSDLRQF